MKVSFIATVFNEEKTIDDFIKSIFWQSRMPDEIIIVDGGSTDNTIAVISNFQFPISNTKTRIKLIFKKGNRSVGRNEAIRRSTSEIIACSDAGCILDKNWVKNIVEPFIDPKVNVVAGYYKGKAKTIFQKCLIPYVLVMPDKVNVDDFLPASRSIAFKKAVWEKVGGFDEKYSHNEDYVFAKRLKGINAKIVFEKRAVVYWAPRSNVKDAFIMFYRFALGDAQARIFRPKVAFIFLRYALAIVFLFLFFVLKSSLILNTLCLMIFIYILWSIIKNYKYVKDIRAILFLPLLQVVSDAAVMVGTIGGFFL